MQPWRTPQVASAASQTKLPKSGVGIVRHEPQTLPLVTQKSFGNVVQPTKKPCGHDGLYLDLNEPNCSANHPSRTYLLLFSEILETPTCSRSIFCFTDRPLESLHADMSPYGALFSRATPEIWTCRKNWSKYSKYQRSSLRECALLKPSRIS
jgi:hypothetical protein